MSATPADLREAIDLLEGYAALGTLEELQTLRGADGPAPGRS